MQTGGNRRPVIAALEADMNTVQRHPELRPAGGDRPPYPLHTIVAAVERAETDRVVSALGEVHFARGRVEVFTAEDVPGLDQPIGGAGLRGFLTRLSLSMGSDLDEIEQARRELAYGHALVSVPVHDDVERHRAHAILREHGGHAMRYFGRWTIATLEGDAH